MTTKHFGKQQNHKSHNASLQKMLPMTKKSISKSGVLSLNIIRKQYNGSGWEIQYILTASLLLFLCCKWNQGKITDTGFIYFHLIIFTFSTEKGTLKLGISFIF